MLNLTNEQLLNELPICNIGQLSKDQQRFLERMVKQDKVNKTKWWWSIPGMGSMKTWYHPV